MSEASLEVLAALRRTDNLQWYVVPLFIFVIYVYVVECQKEDWSAVLLGIAFWGAELIWEMLNALVLHFTAFAPLWTTPGRSAFVIYAGLNIEICLFFAVTGILVIKSLPRDRELMILGLSNRLIIPIGFGLLGVFVEVLLNRGGLLIWDWWFWGWPHIWLILVAYCGPLWIVAWCHDHWSMGTKKKAAVWLPALALLCHLLLATGLHWI